MIFKVMTLKAIQENPSNNLKFFLALSLFLLSLLPQAHAGEQGFIQWQTSNLQLLRGSDYELSDPDGTIITFEYANQWSHGDFFMFVDATRFSDGEKDAYGEISPRFSLGKIAAADLSSGIIQDWYLATTIEMGEAGLRTYLAGIGIDLALPGFSFANANLYLRHNPDLDDDTWQITLAWQYPFSIDQTKLVTEGFADITGDADPGFENNHYIAPRLLVDVSKLVNLKPENLWLGVEYSYWTNKYGVDGVNERAIQAQLKWVFL